MKSFSCFECKKGFYRESILPYKTVDGQNKDMIILDVPHYICSNCGDTCFGMKALRMIEESRIEAGVKYRN
jgi:YgiT-type zinc finger domain-containing protein